MSGEVALWRYVSTGMRGRWTAQRHEDRYTAGIPDVSYALNGVDGWLELKALERPGAAVSVGVTDEQALWLRRRGLLGGGRCFVLARIAREHLLFRFDVANVLTCPQSLEGLRVMAEVRWAGSIDFNQFAERLTRRREP